jgi:hypothetical protein
VRSSANAGKALIRRRESPPQLRQTHFGAILTAEQNDVCHFLLAISSPKIRNGGFSRKVFAESQKQSISSVFV